MNSRRLAAFALIFLCGLLFLIYGQQGVLGAQKQNSRAVAYLLDVDGTYIFETGEAAMRVSWSVIVPVVTTVSAFFILVLSLVVRAWLKQPRTGEHGLIGKVGVALTDLDDQGKVRVQGECWNARSDRLVPKGEKVRVIRVDRLSLVVTRDAGG